MHSSYVRKGRITIESIRPANRSRNLSHAPVGCWPLILHHHNCSAVHPAILIVSAHSTRRIVTTLAQRITALLSNNRLAFPAGPDKLFDRVCLRHGAPTAPTCPRQACPGETGGGLTSNRRRGTLLMSKTWPPPPSVLFLLAFVTKLVYAPGAYPWLRAVVRLPASFDLAVEI
jgi:hypothetical protein